MTSPSVFQIRIELLDIEPPIWRRIQVLDTCTFWELHTAIQCAFGWNDSHAHEFWAPTCRGEFLFFGVPTRGVSGVQAGWKHHVRDHLSERSPQLKYAYGKGDRWWHTLTLEAIVRAKPGKSYPRCTDGERAAPPNDCHGPPGYASLLKILANTGHREPRSSREWAAKERGARGIFNPEAFDEQRVKFADPDKRLFHFLTITGEVWDMIVLPR